jgi:hypothetical protein
MIYVKFSQLDVRVIRLALLILAVVGSGRVIMGLPISGDVSG